MSSKASALLFTYRNHVLYTVVYSWLLSYFGNALSSTISNVSSSTPSSWSTPALYALASLLVAYLIKLEISYVLLRRKLPMGDSGWPILGHVPQMISGQLSSLNSEKQKIYGSIFTINLLGTPTVVFTEDEDVNWVTLQERAGNTAPHKMPVMDELLGEEVIMFCSGQRHKKLRRMLEPIFNPKSLKYYEAVIDTSVKQVLERWSQSENFHGCNEFSFLALELFFVCAMGDRLPQTDMVKLSTLFKEWFDGFRQIPIAFPGSPLSRSFARRRELKSILKELISSFKLKNPEGSTRATSTMLGRLCYGKDEDGENLSLETLIDNVLIVIFAGHDTTKGSLAAMFFYLSKYPEIYQLLAEEAYGYADPLNMDQLKSTKHAPILNAFLAETWRINIPVYGHITQVQSDMHYKGFRIPKGAAVNAILQAAHFDESRFCEPHEFKLERWLAPGHPRHDSNWYVGDKVDPSIVSAKYRAFGAGPHMCLGMHFARLETRTIMARLVKAYTVETKNYNLVKFPLLQIECDFRVSKKVSGKED